ncbi:MAG: DUF4340 domain-containing protein [Ruminococcus sp.]|nr:DUF4340 domain-containing protein [Ruminococcus sp.]
MNGKIQGIIIGGVVVAALGGTLAFLELTGKDPGGTEDSSSSVVSKAADDAEAVTLISVEQKDIQKVIVDNAFGGYTLERPSSGKSEFNIVELTGLNQSSVMKSGLVEDLASLEAYKTVEENTDDLAKYGLAEPETKFTVEFADGSSRSFRIGDVSTKNRYRYFCEEGKSTVYMVLSSVLNNMIDRKEDYVSLSLIGSNTDSTYGRLEVERKDLDYICAFEDIEEERALISSQVMVEPIFAHLNITTSSGVTHGLFGLSAAYCEKIFPSEEDWEAYGLNDPLAVVHYENETQNYTLTIGNEIHATDDNGNETDEVTAYYGYVKGVTGADCIWQFTADTVPWATFLPGDVTSMMTSNKIFDVNEVVINANGKTYDYTLSGSEAENSVYWVKLDGTQDITPGLFQGLYKYLLSCPTNEIYFEEAKGDPFLTIDINRTDGLTDKLEFYQDTSRRVIVAINYKPSYKIESRWTDVFISNIDRINRGEEVQDNA